MVTSGLVIGMLSGGAGFLLGSVLTLEYYIVYNKWKRAQAEQPSPVTPPQPRPVVLREIVPASVVEPRVVAVAPENTSKLAQELMLAKTDALYHQKQQEYFEGRVQLLLASVHEREKPV